MQLSNIAKSLGVVVASVYMMSSAQAGFLDSISTIRNVVGNIGYTANTVSGAKDATKEMADNLGLTKKVANLTQPQVSSNGSLTSGDVLVGKLASVKLYSDTSKTKIVSNLSQTDQIVFLGEEQNGLLHVSTDKGDGWVQKPLVARR